MTAVVTPRSEAVERPTQRRTARRRGQAPGAPRRIAYLYLAPALILYGAFVLLPLLHNVWLSFFEWDGVSLGRFVGLDNYSQVLTSPRLHAALGRSAVLVIFYSLLPICFGLLLAAVLARRPLRGLTAYRTVLFLPQVVATVSAAVAWVSIYGPNGPLNTILGAVGLGGLRETWLGSPTFALSAVGLIGTWMTTGLCFVLFLAGIQRIPPELYDAARVDGCGAIREFFAVTLPGLRSEVGVVLPLTIIAGLRTFDVIFVATTGGPGDATTTPSLIIFLDAFRYGQVGSAAAVAVVLAVLILIVTVGIRRLIRDPE